MASLKQIEANRRNAGKSTGPRTPEGKAASRWNALKTGIDAQSQIIRGEDPDALESLTADFYERYQPATPEERSLVDSLVRAEWLQRRLARAEAELWEFEMREPFHPSEDLPVGQAFSRASNVFVRLQRRIDAAGRSFRQTLRELERLRKERPSQPQQSTTPAPEIGFVPENLPAPENLRASAPPRPSPAPLSPPSPPSPPPPGLPPAA